MCGVLSLGQALSSMGVKAAWEWMKACPPGGKEGGRSPGGSLPALEKLRGSERFLMEMTFELGPGGKVRTSPGAGFRENL